MTYIDSSRFEVQSTSSTPTSKQSSNTAMTLSPYYSATEMTTFESLLTQGSSTFSLGCKPSSLHQRRSDSFDRRSTANTAAESDTSQLSAHPTIAPIVINRHLDTHQASVLLNEAMHLLKRSTMVNRPHSLFALLRCCPHNVPLDLALRRHQNTPLAATHPQNSLSVATRPQASREPLPPRLYRNLQLLRKTGQYSAFSKLSNMCVVSHRLQQLLLVCDRMAHRFPLAQNLLKRTTWTIRHEGQHLGSLDVRWEGGAVFIFHSNVYQSAPTRATSIICFLPISPYNHLSSFASQDYPKPIKTSKEPNPFDKNFTTYNHFMDPISNPFPSTFFSYFPQFTSMYIANSISKEWPSPSPSPPPMEVQDSAPHPTEGYIPIIF